VLWWRGKRTAWRKKRPARRGESQHGFDGAMDDGGRVGISLRVWW